jgi:ATP-binding protein involved in chromosome partitioning
MNVKSKTAKAAFEKTKLPHIKNIIIVASGKGGVGKSTVAASLALSLAREGYATGLLDADIHGPSVPTLFNLNHQRPLSIEKEGKTWIEPFDRNGIRVISIGCFIDPSQSLLWRGPMVTNALKQLLNDTDWGVLDYLIIDTPPGTGDVHLTLLQSYEITGAIVVTTPQAIALDDVVKAIGMFNNKNVAVPVLGIVENMSWFTPTLHPEERYFLFGEGGGERLSQRFHIPLIAQIPMNEHIRQSCDEGSLDSLFQDEQIRRSFTGLVESVLAQRDLNILENTTKRANATPPQENVKHRPLLFHASLEGERVGDDPLCKLMNEQSRCSQETGDDTDTEGDRIDDAIYK